ncbi:MAG: hypothetical protein AABY64_01880 [Bdellovibrionota bacterium]
MKLIIFLVMLIMGFSFSSLAKEASTKTQAGAPCIDKGGACESPESQKPNVSEQGAKTLCAGGKISGISDEDSAAIQKEHCPLQAGGDAGKKDGTAGK